MWALLIKPIVDPFLGGIEAWDEFRINVRNTFFVDEVDSWSLINIIGDAEVFLDVLVHSGDLDFTIIVLGQLHQWLGNM